MALSAANAKRQGRYFAQYDGSVDPQGRPMRSLCDSAAEPLRMSEVLALASPEEQLLWDDLRLDYSSKDGRLELRREVASRYGDGISEGEVTILVPEEGIFLAMAAALSSTTAADGSTDGSSSAAERRPHVVCTSPAFQSLSEHAESLNCEVDFWEPRLLLPDTGGDAATSEVAAAARWWFSVDDLAALLRPDTALVVINMPHNPTGALCSQPELERIVELSRTVGARIFADEIYSGLELDPAARLTPIADLYERGLSMNGLSKSLSAPGTRIGWVASRDSAWMERIRELHDYTTESPPAPSEVLGLIVLRNAERIQAANLATVRSNLDVLREFFQRHDELFIWPQPQAGTVCLPCFRKGKLDRSIEEYCVGLAERERIMLVPASVYGSHYAEGGHFRVGFGRKDMTEVLALFEAALTERSAGGTTGAK